MAWVCRAFMVLYFIPKIKSLVVFCRGSDLDFVEKRFGLEKIQKSTAVTFQGCQFDICEINKRPAFSFSSHLPLSFFRGRSSRSRKGKAKKGQP